MAYKREGIYSLIQIRTQDGGVPLTEWAYELTVDEKMAERDLVVRMEASNLDEYSALEWPIRVAKQGEASASPAEDTNLSSEMASETAENDEEKASMMETEANISLRETTQTHTKTVTLFEYDIVFWISGIVMSTLLVAGGYFIWRKKRKNCE